MEIKEATLNMHAQTQVVVHSSLQWYNAYMYSRQSEDAEVSFNAEVNNVSLQTSFALVDIYYKKLEDR